jgi:beta-glucosidase
MTNKLFLLFFAITFSAFAQKKIKPKAEFVAELLSKMTVEEKIYQLVQFTSDGTITGPKSGDNYITRIQQGKVGSVLNATGAANNRKIQQLAVENSRLKIPLLFAHDVIHGYKTIFPINLGMASSFDLKAVELAARVAAREASSGGIHWTFAPMVDIARDPRWGRVSEGSGEDTFLGSKMAVANVKGFQGDLSGNDMILACAKHFAAYGAAEAGRDYNTTDMSERVLRDTYLPPFKAAAEAGAKTFMAAFNEISGVPSTGNTHLLRDILKGEWKFDGIVVSDYTGVNEMIAHGFAKDEQDAAQLAINAGMDVDMVGATFMTTLKKSYDAGKVSLAVIDDACKRVLNAKYDLGLFQDPYRYFDEKREKETIYKPEFLEASLEVAKKSLVLLKNTNNVLPLKQNQRIAFVGPLASDDSNIIGSWAALGDRSGFATSVKEGVDKLLGSNSKATFDTGVDFQGTNAALRQKALDNARNADVIVAVMGERENQSGEAGSQTSIDLPQPQKELLAELKKLGKPIVLVLMNGRPLTLSWENDNMDAILETWWSGTRGGDAIAQTLFGMNNPSGKLPISFPRNVGQIPIYYNHKNTGRPYLGLTDTEQKYKSRYTDVENSPLYPFGFGLSYTTFAYSNLKVSTPKFRFNEKLIISVDVANTGNYDGEEVVQLYIKDLVGSVTRPVRELKGFEKIMLKKGERRTVTFEVSSDDLKFYNINMKNEAEAGEFEIFAGGSSEAQLSARVELVK